MGFLDGKCAIVTGGSRGIGRAVVERLAADGASVVFGYRDNVIAANQVERGIRAAGGQAKAIPTDLHTVAGVRQMFAQAEDALGALDIVVFNAALCDYWPIEDETEEHFDLLMSVNTKATFFGLQEAGRRLRDGGRIVTVSSINTHLEAPNSSLYSGSKAAVEQFTVIAAKELGSRGITANVVSPGGTDTDMLRAMQTPEGLVQVAARSPLGRIGQPNDVADIIAFLVGPDGRWMTGQNLRASGGFI